MVSECSGLPGVQILQLCSVLDRTCNAPGRPHVCGNTHTQPRPLAVSSFVL